MLNKYWAASRFWLVMLSLIVGLSACKNDTTATDKATDKEVQSEGDVSHGQASNTQTSNTQTSNTQASSTGEDEYEGIASRLEKARPGIKITSIQPSELDNILRVEMQGGGALYLVKGTDYFFLGDLYQIQPQGFVNISEKAKEGLRADLLAKVSAKDMIVYSPLGETKKRITVFTDVDCGYCRKLHREIPALNAKGIELRYLAYPRAGKGSNSYNKIASAWCAEDPLDAMNKLKGGEQIPIQVCDGHPVDSQYDLGGQMGVRGTPAIILDSGEMLPGYMPADDLAKRVGI